MKPKIALAKYLDWAVLAILAVGSLVVAIRSFLLKATGEEKLRDEITQYDQTVQNGMNDTSAQPQPLARLPRRTPEPVRAPGGH